VGMERKFWGDGRRPERSWTVTGGMKPVWNRSYFYVAMHISSRVGLMQLVIATRPNTRWRQSSETPWRITTLSTVSGISPSSYGVCFFTLWGIVQSELPEGNVRLGKISVSHVEGLRFSSNASLKRELSVFFLATCHLCHIIVLLFYVIGEQIDDDDDDD